MKVIFAAAGKFHIEQQLKQLLRLGVLKRFFGSINPDFLPDNKKLIFKPYNIITSLSIQFPFSRFDRQFFYYLNNILFDSFVYKNLDGADILHSYCGMTLNAVKKANESGILTLVERASSHILYAKSIMDEEYELWGIKNRTSIWEKKNIESDIENYKIAKWILLPSSFAANSYRKYGFNNIKIIPLGRNLPVIDAIKKKENFYVIYFGNIGFRKGVLYLLEAVKDINVETVLIGGVDNNIKKLLKKYKFIYHPQLEHKKLIEFLDNASVFVFPTLEDGFGMVMLEAMARGVPVIATKNSAAPDIIRDGVDGFVINIRDVEAIKEKILFFYEKRDAVYEFGRNAIETAKKFSWDFYGDNLYRVYQEIL